ncbi:MAG: 50S ribosomal protein L21 [Spirochaetota bacterium]|nr:50S ribosomal protein L21 [Spirochaetota bacterium]
MYALVEIKGKQYKVVEGDVLTVDKLENEAGDTLEFDTVLLTSNEGDVKVGTPYVDGVKIQATVEEHAKGTKIFVHKFKKRKGYRRKQGHRQKYSKLKVTGITGV